MITVGTIGCEPVGGVSAVSQACYAAMASDEIRAESSSGGAFTILARSFLARGGAVCGAAFDGDFRCRYEIVRDEALLLNTAKGAALFDAVRGDFAKVSEYPPSILEESQARLRSPRNVPPGRDAFWRILGSGGATVKDAVSGAQAVHPPA